MLRGGGGGGFLAEEAVTGVTIVKASVYSSSSVVDGEDRGVSAAGSKGFVKPLKGRFKSSAVTYTPSGCSMEMWVLNRLNATFSYLG